VTKVKNFPNGTILTDPELISEGVKQGVVEFRNKDTSKWWEGISSIVKHIQNELDYGRIYRKCAYKKHNTKKPKPIKVPKLKQFPEVKMNVQKGTIKVKRAYRVAGGPRLVAIEVDLKSKHAVYAGLCWGDIGEIILGKDENTLWTDNRYKKDTYISFPEYKDWEFHSHSVSRYTLSVCLVKGTKK
jgi:hypothetical protein